MYKNIFFRIVIGCLCALVAPSSKTYAATFLLEGHIEGMNQGWLYLNYLPGNDKRGILDSAWVSRGHFQFKGSIAEPSLANLSTFNLLLPGSKNDNKQIIQFYLDKGKITIQLKYSPFSTVRVEGSPTETERVKLERLKRPYQERANNVEKLLRENKTSDSLRTLIGALEKKQCEIDSFYIIEHPNSFLAADMLSNTKHYDIAFPSLEALYQRFPNWIRETTPGRKLYQEVQKEKIVYPGVRIQPFTALTSQQDTFRLEACRGRKYLLLDFWASWCAPCRQATPYLKKWLQPYADSVEIIGIACWDSDSNWTKAIADDKMEWTQINDSTKNLINPAGGSISAMYRINLLPSWILIDKDGKVVNKYGGWYRAKHLFELRTDLEAIFKK